MANLSANSNYDNGGSRCLLALVYFVCHYTDGHLLITHLQFLGLGSGLHNCTYLVVTLVSLCVLSRAYAYSKLYSELE